MLVRPRASTANSPASGPALDASALDSSPSALAAAATTVNIGTPNWNAYPITPATYTVSVGDKLSFQFTQSHNVWVKPAPDCVFTGGTELASSICGAARAVPVFMYERAPHLTASLRSPREDKR